MYKFYQIIAVLVTLFFNSAYASDSMKQFLHVGTGKVFSFSPNGEYFVQDLLRDGRCAMRARSLNNFPEEYRNLIVDKVIGPYCGNLHDFSKRFGELTLSNDENYYIRGGAKYYLQRITDTPIKCSKEVLNDTTVLSKESFDLLIDIFETYYPSFKERGIDWESKKTSYKTKFVNAKNGQEFFLYLKDFLSDFNDIHIKAFYYNGNNTKPFDPDLISDWESGGDFIPQHHTKICSSAVDCDEAVAELNLQNVLNEIDPGKIRYFLKGETFDYNENEEIYNSSIIWSKGEALQIDGKKISYLCLRHNIKNLLKDEKNLSEIQREEQIQELFTKIVSDIKDSDALILDNRSNWGGSDHFVKTISSFFTESPKESFSTKWTSENYKDTFYTTASNTTFIKPIFLMTDTYVASAGENLVLYLNSQNHVLTIGKPTRGCYSTMLSKELSNGIVITLPAQQTFDANGAPMEGKGIAPAINLNTSDMNLIETIDVIKNSDSYQISSLSSLNMYQEQLTWSWTKKMIEEKTAAEFAREYNYAHPNAEENGYGPFALVPYNDMQSDLTGESLEAHGIAADLL